MNGKMSKWFTVHNRHLVPGNPSCPQYCSSSCASAWPGATFLSRRACVRFLAELKMWSKTKAGKTEPPPPLPEPTKNGKGKVKIQISFSPCASSRADYFWSKLLCASPPHSRFACSLCLLGCLFVYLVSLLFVCLLNNPLPPFVTPCAASRPRPSAQTQMPMKTISCRFIYLFI